ncbi:MAG TPA: DUF2225 domain-containing protein, partial [Candidatus Kapabacteria bacterium]|nr:DUF2225 domain-containing protein [Candidatus Kapabacteria bacterium]
MIKNKKIRFIFILILLLKVFVFGQDIDNITDEKMKEEILSIYKSGGEAGLRSFLKTRIDSVDNKLFLTLSTTGVKENNKDLLDIASIIAEEKKDERFLSVVNTYKGLYFIVTADYEKMEECFNKAISVFKKYKTFKKSKTLLTYLKQIKKAIDALKKNNFKKMIEILEPLLFTQGQPVDYRYRAMLYMVKGADYAIKNEFKKALFMFDMALYCYEKINDVDNQGKVYYHKGYMYQEIHDTMKAEEMFNKALTLFEKSGNFTEQGNLYLEKGNIRYFAGEYSKALHQYNRALSFFEKIQNNQGQG